MMSINQAYSDGDLDALRDIEIQRCPADKDNKTLTGLKLRLKNVLQKIEFAKLEAIRLRRSDLYKIKRKLLKSDRNVNEILDEMAETIKIEINRKEIQLKQLTDQLHLVNE